MQLLLLPELGKLIVLQELEVLEEQVEEVEEYHVLQLECLVYQEELNQSLERVQEGLEEVEWLLVQVEGVEEPEVSL